MTTEGDPMMSPSDSEEEEEMEREKVSLVSGIPSTLGTNLTVFSLSPCRNLNTPDAPKKSSNPFGVVSYWITCSVRAPPSLCTCTSRKLLRSSWRKKGPAEGLVKEKTPSGLSFCKMVT